MESVQGITLNESSKEERLPGFASDFPYIANRVFYAEPLTPWHWHRPVELFYIEKGCLEYTTPHGKWTFPAGSGGFVNSNVLHTTWIPAASSETVTLIHIFDPSLLSGGPGSRMESRYILPLTTARAVEMIPLFPEDPAQKELLDQIRQAFRLSTGEWGCEFALREAMTRIWLGLLEVAKPTAGGSRADDKIKALMVYIHEHYREPISVEQLAREAHISKRLCFRLFRENLHMSPLEYMQSYRLQKACQMLSQTDAPITQVAYACGLGSSSYFGKQFREAFGCTPAQYRKKARS